MRLGKCVIGILVVTLTAFLITEIAEARFRGGFYRSQQSYRYNSASSNYAARQARFATQTRLRTQQNAMRQQQFARRQAMRTQQTQMRNRMRTRQQQAIQKRTQMAERQRRMLQQRQERMVRNRGARAPNTAKLQKEFQRRNALKRERLQKERKDRLRRLEEKRKRDADKQSKDSRDTTTMAALLTRRALPSASTTTRFNSSTSLNRHKSDQGSHNLGISKHLQSKPFQTRRVATQARLNKLNKKSNNVSANKKDRIKNRNLLKRQDPFGEKLKTELSRSAPKPSVKDPALRRIVEQNYRPNAKVGSGSTADAIRLEKKTGTPVGGRFHEQKGRDTLRSLKKWVKKNEFSDKVSDPDKQAAKNMIKDLEDALDE